MDKLLGNLGCVHAHVRSKLTPILTNRKLTANGIAISVIHMDTWIFSNFVLWILSVLFLWAHCVTIISASPVWNKQNMILGRLKERKRQWQPVCNVSYANESERNVTQFLKYISCEALQIGSQVFWCAFRWKILEKELKLDSISIIW